MWNYWRVEYLAIRSKNVIGEIFIGSYEYCTERNPYSLNGVHLIWQNLRHLPNRRIKATAKYTTYMVN